MQPPLKKKLSPKDKAAIWKLHTRGLMPSVIGRKLRLHGQQVAGYIRTTIYVRGHRPDRRQKKGKMYEIERKLLLLTQEVNRLRVAFERGTAFQVTLLPQWRKP